jgi:hypothetical protein
MACIRASHVAFNAIYSLIPWWGQAKIFSYDIGDHRTKKLGFKTCVIMALPVNTGKAG